MVLMALFVFWQNNYFFKENFRFHSKKIELDNKLSSS